MQSFTLIKLFLVFFFLGKHIRVLVNVATGNDIAGALVDDIAIVVLVLWFVTYSLGVRPISELRLDRVQLFLLAILAAALLQAAYFASTFDGDVASVLFRAFSPFRKIFMPLMLALVLSYLIKNEIIKSGDLIIKRFVKLFTMFLWVAIAYNFLEGTLRTIVPVFNSLYLDYVFESIIQQASPTVQHMEDIPIHVLLDLNGPSIKRVYGIGLDMYASGGIIFSCYLFHVFMSGKFRVLSILNCLVFVALLLSGSRVFIVPFLVLNVVFFVRQHVRKNFLAPISIAMILAGGVALLIRLMIPTFDSTVGYFPSIERSLVPVMQNLGLFIFGIGPVGFTPFGQKIVGELQYELAHMVAGTGYLAISLEVGLIMSALFVLFHLVVFRTKGNISGRRQLPDQYTKGLKILIVLNMVVALAHWPILFDRTIIVFHVLFLSLLYSWSRLEYREYLRFTDRPCAIRQVVAATG